MHRQKHKFLFAVNLCAVFVMCICVFVCLWCGICMECACRSAGICMLNTMTLLDLIIQKVFEYNGHFKLGSM